MDITFKVSILDPVTGGVLSGEIIRHFARLPDAWDWQEKMQEKLDATYSGAKISMDVL